MRSFRIGLILSGGLALILSLATSCQDRQELQKVTAANDFLRKSLADMAVAITAREKEIRRLQEAGCVEKERTLPGVPRASVQ